MRIVLIVTQMEGGGAQRAAILAARRFRELGHEAETWFLFRRRGIYDGEPHTTCLFPRDPQWPSDYARILVQLVSHLRRRAPDAVLTFSHYANVLGCLVAAFCRVPNRLARHSGLPDRSPLPARLLDCLWGTVGIYTAVLANSRTTAAALTGYPAAYRGRVHTVCDGVSPMTTSVTKAEARRILGLEGDALCIAAVGRLSLVKNHCRLMAAVANIPGVHLVVAGDGGERPAIEAAIAGLGLAGRVRLLGDVPPETVALVYRAADLFVHPSLWESFGMSVVEAAGVGLPLALSDIPSLHEIADGDCGNGALYFAPTSVAHMTEVLRRLVTDAALRNDLARRSAALARRFSAEAMADGFLAILTASSPHG